MSLPEKEEAQKLLETHVKDEYQRLHARMVATAMEGYARKRFSSLRPNRGNNSVDVPTRKQVSKAQSAMLTFLLYTYPMRTPRNVTPLTDEEKAKLLAKSALKVQPATEKQWGTQYPYFSTAMRVGKKN